MNIELRWVVCPARDPLAVVFHDGTPRKQQYRTEAEKIDYRIDGSVDIYTGWSDWTDVPMEVGK